MDHGSCSSTHAHSSFSRAGRILQTRRTHEHFNVHVSFVGEAQCGKTQIVNRLCQKQFSEKYIPSIGERSLYPPHPLESTCDGDSGGSFFLFRRCGYLCLLCRQRWQECTSKLLGLGRPSPGMCVALISVYTLLSSGLKNQLCAQLRLSSHHYRHAHLVLLCFDLTSRVVCILFLHA